MCLPRPQPLMKPLNRLELEIAGGLRRLLQKLRVGDGAWLDWLGTATASGTEPLARIPHAQQLFEGCMEAVLNSIISSDAAGLHELQAEGLAQQGDPTLSNRDVLTFNALVHAMHSFILHMQALDRRIEDVLVMRQPLDLRRVNYV
jgi:hypothetical protein